MGKTVRPFNVWFRRVYHCSWERTYHTSYVTREQAMRGARRLRDRCGADTVSWIGICDGRQRPVKFETVYGGKK